MNFGSSLTQVPPTNCDSLAIVFSVPSEPTLAAGSSELWTKQSVRTTTMDHASTVSPSIFMTTSFREEKDQGTVPRHLREFERHAGISTGFYLHELDLDWRLVFDLGLACGVGCDRGTDQSVPS